MKPIPKRHTTETTLDSIIHDLARTVAMGLLSPSLIDLIEREIPEAQPGDISAGRIVLMHVRPFTTHVELGVLMPGASGLQNFRISFIEASDIALLAKMVRMLDEWEKKSTTQNDGGRDGTHEN